MCCDGQVGDGDHAHSGITIRSSVATELFEIPGIALTKSGLLVQFAGGRLVQVLVGTDKAAGEGPLVEEGFAAPPDQRNMQDACTDGENGPRPRSPRMAGSRGDRIRRTRRPSAKHILLT